MFTVHLHNFSLSWYINNFSLKKEVTYDSDANTALYPFDSFLKQKTLIF